MRCWNKITNDISILPRLRSFEGSFEHSTVICNHQRPLETLVITLVQPPWWENSVHPNLSIPLASHLSLTKLHVLALEDDGRAVKLTKELSPASLAQLASSFPKLVDLDTRISQRMIEYREKLVLLTKLQKLRLQEYKTHICTCPQCSFHEGGKCYTTKRPVTKVFPPSDYITEFALLLPSLPQLTWIEVHILGDHIFPVPEANEDILFEPAEMELEYRFSVNRTSSGSEVILNNTHISSDKRHCFC